jgi:uncharacterized protein YprB with RNaseH-like and TPR domain
MGKVGVGDQLRRMGLTRGAGKLVPSPWKHGRPIEELLPGEIVHTEAGPFFLLQDTYELEHRHGHHSLASLLTQSAEHPVRLARDERFAALDFSQMAFVDTETTGLAGGTGTYAFLVGVGVFEETSFTIHQFFMRDYDEESAQLQALGELLDRLEAVVSFNGKSFDLPLLETRFILARQPPRLTDAPHLDLLPAARRFWKYRLDSCALSSLETEVLGVRRSQEDVPGWYIPQLYMDYARSGDARDMPRIFYHNAQDILSLVTLTARLCELLIGVGDLPGEDRYGLGRFFHEFGQLAEAEQSYAQAAESARSSHVREMAMRDLAYLFKRQERRAEALPWWERLVETRDAIYACEELAKHYEWHDPDLAQATAWTQRGIAIVEAWPPDRKRREALGELEHRLARLGHKQQLQNRNPTSPGG